MILYYLIHTTLIGFYTLCFVLSKGFYFYFVIFFSFLYKIFPNSFFLQGKNYFLEKQDDPTSFLSFILIVLIGVFCYVSFYPNSNSYFSVTEELIEERKEEFKEKDLDGKEVVSKDYNLYKNYEKYNFRDISFNKLKEINLDVVAWIMVDGTHVNYPVVQTDNNDYYLNHDITKNLKGSGWVFMDYRNDSNLTDQNTIFYGHNLINQTSFGSLSLIFKNEWFTSSNHTIVVLTPGGKYVYEVFSCYIINPETYYLQTNFYNDEYHDFLNTLKSRSIYDFATDVSDNDSIITLSTCTDDNLGRRVIHARKIKNK